MKKRKETVLIVDDSSSARMKVVSLVKAGGYQTSEAENGNIAYEKIKSEKPACVLLDLLMPELDGTGLLMKLQNEGITVPVIVVTSDVQEATREECMQYGAFDLINKPIVSELLISMIDHAVFGEAAPFGVSDAQMDALKEIINVGMGRSAATLNKITNKRIKFQIPYIKFLARADLEKEIRNELKSYEANVVSVIKMDFKGSFSGTVRLAFPKDSALQLVKLIADEESFTDDMDLLRVTTLTEIGNIVLNSLMGSMTNLLKVHLQFSLPKYFEDNFKEMVMDDSSDTTYFILAKTHFTIMETEILGGFMISMEVNSFEKFINMVARY